MPPSQINLQPQSFGFRAASVPSNPIPGAITDLAETTEKQVFAISKIIQKQDEIVQDYKSLSQFNLQEADLQSKISNIQDPQEKSSVYQTGIGDILSNIKQQYPRMSDRGNAKLQYASDIKFIKMQHDSIINQERKNKSEAAATLHNLIASASWASGNDERQELERQGMDFINKMAYTGMWGPEEKDFIANKFLHAIVLNKATELAVTNPTLFLSEATTSPQNFLLSSKKLQSLKDNAVHVIDQQYQIASEQYEKMKIDKINESMKDPSKAFDNWKNKWISDLVYQRATGEVPSNPQAMFKILDTVNEISDPDELVKYHDRYITQNPDLSKSDVATITPQYEHRLQNLKNVQGKHAANLIMQLEEKVDKSLGANKSLNKDKMKEFNHLLSNTKYQLYRAKDANEQKDIFDEASKFLDENKVENSIAIRQDGKLSDKWDADTIINNSPAPTPGQE